MPETTFSERFRQLLRMLENERGMSMTALGKEIGVGASTLSKWLRGTSPTVDKVAAIARASNVSLAWLAGGEGEMRPKEGDLAVAGRDSGPAAEDEIAWIPRLDVKASAGHGAYLDGPLAEIERVPFNRTVLVSQVGSLNNLEIIDVAGDSMEPTLRNGDIMLVRRIEEFTSDALYVISNGLVQVKRLQVVGRDRIRVGSDNPDYQSPIMSLEEFDAEYRVVARVVWSGRRF